jgi:glutamine amidotransferase
MCRFVAWFGAERYLEDFVFAPEHSIVAQSKKALISKTPINADGFGLAWYQSHPEPCIYKGTHPAWSDPNLKQLAHHVKAGLFLAHVRASTGMATSRNNCHPFGCGQWCFMHNGQAGGHEEIRKDLDALIPDDLYQYRLGATESEAIFLIAMGMGLATRPIAAMAEAVLLVQELSRTKGKSPHMRFSACWSDGDRIYAARYASDVFSPSLFYTGTGEVVIVSSEPLSTDGSEWNEVKPNEALIVQANTIEKQVFLTDDFLEQNRPIELRA